MTSPNAYALAQTRRRGLVTGGIAVIGLVGSAVLGFRAHPPTLWGITPILLYAVLCLLGTDLVIATVVCLVCGVLIAHESPVEFATLLGSSMGDVVTQIGLIIMLGAGVGEVLRATGVARVIVGRVMLIAGERRDWAVRLGIMVSCLILVTSLGTLAGALAIAAPILLPIAARVGFTRAATSALMFVGGCAGLAVAPFAGSNVAIMKAADVGYLEYLRVGAGPLAVLSIVLALVIVPWIQRRTAGDLYSDTDLEVDTDEPPASAGRATVAFLVTLVATVGYATATSAGTAFPLLALPLIAVVTGAVGGHSATAIAGHVYRGASRLISIFLLFWLLAALFGIIEKLKPFDVILAQYGPSLRGVSGLGFAVAIALLGWVGVPGATAAQVVLLDKVFGGLASTLGIGSGAWVVVLLWASKADTYGPFPNANMIGAMGLARSTDLRSLILTGWLVLIPASAMYVAILAVLT
ncbi:Na+/H+ antiporter NhaC family protein [Pseudonocardia spinosispora]|uniref:Na+/H+ antiporter NhaC family protein n=1 Tax=Pseudonocardia spinosispora TaxID=103441 RepID=UPI0003FDD8E0|nr:Na+/H+ antiporter NhaC family protein [Pseudonocardia spinosispora]